LNGVKMKTVIAIAIFAAFFIAVKSDDPEMPTFEICSIKGSGTAEFTSGSRVFSGKMTMKRTNGFAIYNFSLEDSDGMEASAYLLLRPDLRKSIFSFESFSITIRSRSSELYRLTSYKYAKDFKPVPDMKYICYAIEDRDGKEAAMLFSTDNKKLIGEWFNFADDEDREDMTIKYDKVEDFEHDTVDDTFSIDDENYPDAKKPASDALTSMCGSSLIIPSFVAFVATMVASVLF